MEHRDKIILEKILSEIDIARKMMGTCSLDFFEADEMLKRAVCMTVINIGELVKNLSDDPDSETSPLTNTRHYGWRMCTKRFQWIFPSYTQKLSVF